MTKWAQTVGADIVDKGLYLLYLVGVC